MKNGHNCVPGSSQHPSPWDNLLPGQYQGRQNSWLRCLILNGLVKLGTVEKAELHDNTIVILCITRNSHDSILFPIKNQVAIWSC